MDIRDAITGELVVLTAWSGWRARHMAVRAPNAISSSERDDIRQPV
jgi:hypothetical protein